MFSLILERAKLSVMPIKETAVSLIGITESFALSKINENTRLSINVNRSKINYLLRYWQVLFYLSLVLSLTVFLFSSLVVKIIGGAPPIIFTTKLLNKKTVRDKTKER